MFQHNGEALRRWASGVLGDDLVHLGPPPAQRAGRGLALHLIEVTPLAVSNADRYRRLCATLRYAAIAWAEKVATADRMLDELMFAVMRHPLLDIDRRPVPDTMWRLLGMPPQPVLLLRCEARHELTPRILEKPMRTIYAPTPADSLSGRVVGADGRAVERATVAVPRYEWQARTDDAGRFRLPSLPSQEPVTLVVHANGREEQMRLVQAGGRAAGVVIQLAS